ncbi:2-amino-4-hydroxy-6-hydroxymethyldihydropteridine diphosphokinase [Singulisphaera sp. Ch08]|uniref:2-amino-4-hydroxy-6-hydroxymethyldihydropteridine pyrophosphokinase n=1 Tax=Singulisphaera sp. Ch08 TaxID=3120278 RepID=A0AAU7CQW7_9BACT
MTQALIGLGSNLGDRRSNLESAINALAATPGVGVHAVSTFHETKPVGGPEGQGAFLNAAAALETELGAEPLLDLLNAVEARAKRVRAVRWGARTLDLDLLLYGSQIIQTSRLMVPHPRMALRRFVLAPLNEVATSAIDPMTVRSIGHLLANLDRRPSYLALHGIASPLKEAVFHQVAAKLGGARCSFADLPAPLDPVADRVEQALISVNAMAGASKDGWIVTDFSPHLLCPSASLDRCYPPTFALILKQGLDDDSLADQSGVPHLLIDSCDPDQVVAEALAACAATRS